MRRISLLLIASLLCLAAVFGLERSNAASRPQRLPTGTIYYSDSSGWDASVDRAAQAWNRLGLGPQFVRTTDPSQAGVFISANPGLLEQRCGNCSGLASGVGQTYPNQLMTVTLRPPPPGFLGAIAADKGETVIIIHELGHLLGLEHQDGCAVMSPSPGSRCAPLVWPGPDRALCSPLPADAEAAARLYGVRLAPRRATRWCDY